MTLELQIRAAERRHQAGDADATDRLVNLLTLAGDQAALCELGHHDLSAARADPRNGPKLQCVDPKCIAQDDDADPCVSDTWCLWCVSCSSNVPVPWVVHRRWRKQGDASHLNLCPAEDIHVTGATQWNTYGSSRMLHGVVEANGAAWDVSWFSSLTRTASDLVAKASNVRPGQAVLATERNNSRLQVEFRMGSAPSHGAGPSIWFSSG